jgi:hypothetical protein
MNSLLLEVTDASKMVNESSGIFTREELEIAEILRQRFIAIT